jgi:hypothetical protein
MNQPPARKSSRPKSAKNSKAPKTLKSVIPTSYANYLQPAGPKRKSIAGQKPKKKKKKRVATNPMIGID